MGTTTRKITRFKTANGYGDLRPLQVQAFNELADQMPGETSRYLVEALDILDWSHQVTEWNEAQCLWVLGWLKGARLLWPSRAAGRKERLEGVLVAAKDRMQALSWREPPWLPEAHAARGEWTGYQIILNAFWDAVEQDLPPANLQEHLAHVLTDLDKRQIQHTVLQMSARNLIRQLQEAI